MFNPSQTPLVSLPRLKQLAWRLGFWSLVLNACMQQKKYLHSSKSQLKMGVQSLVFFLNLPRINIKTEPRHKMTTTSFPCTLKLKLLDYTYSTHTHTSQGGLESLKLNLLTSANYYIPVFKASRDSPLFPLLLLLLLSREIKIAGRE